ncbi:hypothetical protein IV102_22150 [bacterium]|nr:hypothetical protein [bacterium]
MKTVLDNPLRRLREGFTASRADFCRRYRLGYQSVALAEVGLVPNPANLIRVLADLTGRPPDELLIEHKSWLANTTAVS